MHSIEISQHKLKDMCNAFKIIFNESVIVRYRGSTISYVSFKDLHMFIKNIRGVIYIDKLWVENKGHGVGTKCFREYLEQSRKPVIWRTRTERRKQWYIRFNGVKLICEYGGYYYFKYTHFNAKMNAWTYEDLDFFHEPSLTSV